VQNITLYFSVSSPTAACCGWWKPLASKPEGVVVLEYAETIDFRHQSRSAAGCNVLACLDDCFSQGSVIFPARRLHFNA
jgi:hypothetical protein